MMVSKQPMQAGGGDGRKGAPDGANQRDGGESDGSAYPNPHSHKKPKDSPNSFLGSGGQTRQGYFGPGQDDGEAVEDGGSGRVGQGGLKKD